MSKVMQLREAFENDLHFDMDEVRLRAKTVHPQVQFEKAINDLITKHDQPYCRNLLIVYYTGHACKFPDRSNDLVFAGYD